MLCVDEYDNPLFQWICAILLIFLAFFVFKIIIS